jgi:WD40 repeat protein/serine/threonine protein kinase
MAELSKDKQPSTADIDPATSPAPGPVTSESLSSLLGYEIIDVLGRGGMGIVYKARQTKLRRLVALKMITASEQPNPRQLARFRTEAEAVARLQHPNIIQIHDVGEVEGHPFYSMEYMEGGSLGKRFRGGARSPRQAAQIVQILAEAMHYAHQNQIIHRDLKPGNILLTRAPHSRSSDDSHASSTQSNASGSVSATSPTGDILDVNFWTLKISDFGLAKQLGEDSGQTRTGDLLGTPSYMAPEQIPGGGRNTGPPTDIYALGAVLYWALTGRPPFRADSPLETLDQVRSQEPTPPSQLQQRIPIDLETICLKCLQKDPSKRYATAQALAEDLGRFQAGEPIKARPVGPLARTWSWCRRNPRLATWIALAWAFLIGGSAASLYFGVQAWRQARQAQEIARREERRSYCLQMMQAHEDYEKQQIKSVRARLEALESKRRQAPSEARGFESCYLERLCHLDLRTMQDAAHVHAVVFDPARGEWLASAGDSGIKIWQTATGRQLGWLREHQGSVRNLAVSSDGRLLASAGFDNTVKCWEVGTWRLIHNFSHPSRVISVAFNKGSSLLASACADGVVRVWDVKSERKVELPGHDGFARGVAFSPTANMLASTGIDKTIRLWDPLTGKPLRDAIVMAAAPRGLAFSPDGQKLAVASSDHTVKLYDTQTWQCMVLHGHADEVMTVGFGPGGSQLVSAASDNTIRTWDVKSGVPLLVLRGHEGIEVDGAAFSPDGRLIASAGENTVKLWDATSDQGFTKLIGHTAYGTPASQDATPITQVSYSADGRRLASASEDGTIRIWRPDSGETERVLKAQSPVRAIAFGSDQCLASGGDDLVVRIWDLRSGESQQLPKQHTRRICSVALSPDGKHVASCAEDGSTLLWPLAGGSPQRLAERQGTVRAVAFSPNGRWLASGADSGMLRIWNLETGACTELPRAHTGILCLAFSPDGRLLASGGTDDLIKLWEPETGQPQQTLKGHTCSVASVQFSRDGSRIISASQCDSSVRVWDTLTGEVIMILHGKPACYCAVLSPDNLQLAGAMCDGTVRIWDARPLTPVIELEREARGMLAYVFRPGMDAEGVAKKIAGDSSASEPVKRRAIELAGAAEAVYLEREAAAIVRSLFGKPRLREEVIEAIRNDKTLREPLRQRAVELASKSAENIDGLKQECTILLDPAGTTSQQHQRALKEAEMLCLERPEEPVHWAFLAMAQYRTDKFSEALATFAAHSQLDSPEPVVQVRELAFTAMAQHRLGRSNEAHKTLERLRQIMKRPFINGRAIAESFLREAEAVTAGSQSTKGPGV